MTYICDDMGRRLIMCDLLSFRLRRKSIRQTSSSLRIRINDHPIDPLVLHPRITIQFGRLRFLASQLLHRRRQMCSLPPRSPRCIIRHLETPDFQSSGSPLLRTLISTTQECFDVRSARYELKGVRRRYYGGAQSFDRLDWVRSDTDDVECEDCLGDVVGEEIGRGRDSA